MDDKKTYDNSSPLEANKEQIPLPGYDENDVFGDEGNNQIKYKTLSWQLVAVLMIAEIVSNGMLSLPSSMAVVGIVPGTILIVFLGIFGTFTSYILIQFKLRHPDVHNMGDAGYILLGPIGREVLSAGTIIFAVFATGGQLLAGQIALGVLSENKLCLMLYTGIFAIPTFLCSLPRTLDRLSWLSIPSVISILAAGIVGMVACAINPLEGRIIDIVVPTDFVTAFISITNPVFAYAGHFMAAYTLQGFATVFYAVFAIVTYLYIGNGVASPSFSSLPSLWAKITFGIAIPNFLIAGSLYSHTAAKLLFVRFFRKSHHLHEHTFVGWSVWIVLIFVMNAAAFVLAVGVPIFNYLIGIAASLFASWYTYGIAGAFWIYDTYHYRGGTGGMRSRPVMTTLNVLTLLAGSFICVAGMYVTIYSIVQAYAAGTIEAPFSC